MAKFSKEELRKKLTEEEYRITQEKGTEAPFSGVFYDYNEKGIYTCKVCGISLFSSDTKFNSGTGWPSFDRPMDKENVILEEDKSDGMVRTEVLCRNCGAHLGHVFPDGPRNLPDGRQATNERFCINSCALDFKGGGKK